MMEDLSLHILDIAENSIAAGAGRVVILINENERRDILTLRITDDGRGMSRTILERALDPFFSTKGKATGLGLAFLSQAAEQCGGRLSVAARPGRGTRVFARFRYRHIDRPPLTRMVETLTTLVVGHPEVDFRYRHRRNGRVFRFAVSPGLRRTLAESGPGPDVIRAVGAGLRSGLKRIGRT